MKYGIISDIHANLEALQVVLAEIDRVGVDRLICLGDVVGYNADPNGCCEILRERKIPTVLGNHDAVACGRDDPSGFNSVALEAALWTRQALNDENLSWLQSLPEMLDYDSFVAVHGAPNNRNTYIFEWEDILPYLPFLEEYGCNLCMIGHTHSPAIFSTDGVYTVDDDFKFELGEGKSFFVNPGSVGQPRDTNPQAAFGYLETETMVFEQVRISYPIEKSQKKILEMGLPQFLSERLALGR